MYRTTSIWEKLCLNMGRGRELPECYVQNSEDIELLGVLLKINALGTLGLNLVQINNPPTQAPYDDSQYT